MEGDTINYEDTERYFDELLHEMRLLNRAKTIDPAGFIHAGALLQNEIFRVWYLLTGEELYSFKLEEEVPIPKVTDFRGRKCNLIGRILGPCGLSVKQLEAETKCGILIRGEGSVKDPERESRLKGLPGWEHLDEPLHVVVISEDTSERLTIEKLQRGVGIVKRLLVPRYDEHKKMQLMTHAIINGTYRENKYRVRRNTRRGKK